MFDAFAEAVAMMREKHDGALGEAGNVASAAGTGQAAHLAILSAPGGIEIAEAINFGSTEEAGVHAALLEEGHDVEHLSALGGVEEIGRIGHGVEELSGGSFADQAIFVEADGVGSVGAFGDDEGEHGEAHADEDEFVIVNFAGCGGDH